MWNKIAFKVIVNCWELLFQPYYSEESANVDHRPEVKVAFAKVGKIESVIPPPLVMIDRKVEAGPTSYEKMYF